MSSRSSLSGTSTPSIEDSSDRRFLQTLNIEPPNFVKLWDDHGTCYKPYDCTVWRPVPPQNFFIGGDVIERGQHDQPRSTISIAMRDPTPGVDGLPLLAAPVDWRKMWDTKGSGAKHGEIAIWQPIPPEGYVALGCVIGTSVEMKPLERKEVMCVLKEAASDAKAQPEKDGMYLWGTSRNVFRTFALAFNANHKYITIWNIKASDREGLTCGCFMVTDMEAKSETRTGLWCVANPSAYSLRANGEKDEMGYLYNSFVPPRRQINCRWFVDGKSYMATVADALESAESEIFISGWCVSPELYLRRTQPVSVEDRLDKILQKMARKGVSVFVLLWWDTEMTVGGTVNSLHAMTTLESLHPNVKVIRHPGGKGKVYWTHHQKFVVIDQQLAFIGGIDLCFGRFDDPEHTLLDPCHMNPQFPGKDYYNPRIQDFMDLNHPFTDLVDRTKVPRMPWHDIHSCVDRDAARDIALNFIQRWNHHLKKKVAGGSHGGYPVLTLAKAPFPQTNMFSRGTCEVQVLRSIGQWSLGLPFDATEHSIQNCYLDLIQNAQHFIYIENQYFISVQNKVAEAIFERISRAIENRETFRVVVLIPITPCGSWETNSIKCVMKWQYETISRGGSSLLERLSAKFPSVPVQNYISFYSLRNVALMNDEIVYDQVYIHSKLMIVDDRIALIGTANINDRSMVGDRDSEIAVVVRDNEFIESRMNGKFFLAAKFAHSLRVSLWMEHLGLKEGSEESVQDPTCNDTYMEWLRTGVMNQTRFTSIFPLTPCDDLPSIQARNELEKKLAAESEVDRHRRRERSLVDMRAIRGHLVAYPLYFLKDEVLDSGFNIEAILPGWVYQ